MSDTPRTDAAESPVKGWLSCDYAVPPSFARQLERELVEESTLHDRTLALLKSNSSLLLLAAAAIELAAGELKEMQRENLVRQRSEMDLCQERDAWRACAERLYDALESIECASCMDSCQPWDEARAAFEKLKGKQ